MRAKTSSRHRLGDDLLLSKEGIQLDYNQAFAQLFTDFDEVKFLKNQSRCLSDR